MKKVITSVLVLILVLSNVSIPAIAAGVEKVTSESKVIDYTQDEIIKMACEVWPENADKLNCSTAEKVQLTRAIDELEIVRSDSYKISDNETLLYYEYSSGYALAAVAEWDASVYSTTSEYTEYVANLHVANGVSSSILYGMSYRLYTYAYDKITFKGIRYNNYATTGGDSFVENETSTNPASYSYAIVFQTTAGDSYGMANVSIKVGGNDVIVDAG